MAYIGNQPLIATTLVDTFSGNGSTTAFTTTVAPASTSSILVAITGVLQDPSTYTVSGTTLTFSTAPPSGTSNISVRYLGLPGIIGTPGPGTVGTSALQSGITLTNAILSGTSSVSALFETATITASAPSSTTNFDVSTQAVQYYTSNAANNFTLNVRGNSGTTLNSILTTGQSVTLALLVTNGATAYYMTALQVDGSAQTIKWQGGTAPSSGNASSIDVYSVTLVKTASATYTALVSQTQYK